MPQLTPQEKDLLHRLFAPESLGKLLEMFGDTTLEEWESIYSKLLAQRTSMTKLILYVDGASDAKIETAGIGGVVYRSGDGIKVDEELLTFSENIGKATNNVAEYTALIRGLEYAQQLNGNEVSIFSDSELMVNQLNLEYKVKNERIMKLHASATELLDGFRSWNIQHIPRGKNRKADILSNQGLRKAGKNNP